MSHDIMDQDVPISRKGSVFSAMSILLLFFALTMALFGVSYVGCGAESICRVYSRSEPHAIGWLSLPLFVASIVFWSLSASEVGE